MRWVWRAERGGSALEYAGLVVIAAALVVALVSAGLSTKVQSSVGEAMCVIMGKDGCQVEAGGPEDGGGGSSPEDGGGSSPSPSSAPSSPGGDPEESEGNNVDYDPELANEYQDAQDELDKAQKGYEGSLDYKELGKDVLKLVSEIIGIEDAKKCITEGDIEACIWTALSAIPWSKVAKVLKKIPKAVKLFNKWRGKVKAASKAKDKLRKLKEKVKGLRKKCKKKKKPRNSFVAGTPVLLADGRSVPIEDIDVGEEVAATSPSTGEALSRPVTDTISGSGVKQLVTLTIYANSDRDRITATDEHPFWVSERQRWVDAEDLLPGDALRTADGREATVGSLYDYGQRQTVYNLTVAAAHTYYVGGGQSLVHNDAQAGSACEPPQRPGPGEKPRKVVNSKMDHAVERGAQRIERLRDNPKAVREELQALGKSIQKDGFPEGTINDTKYADRVLVPFGEDNYVVYQIKPNGNAVIRNVFNKKGD